MSHIIIHTDGGIGRRRQYNYMTHMRLDILNPDRVGPYVYLSEIFTQSCHFGYDNKAENHSRGTIGQDGQLSFGVPHASLHNPPIFE